MKNELLEIIGSENYENFRKGKSVYFYFDNLKTGEETNGYFKKYRSKNNTYETPEYLVSLADDSYSVTLCDLSKVTDLFERGEYRLNSKNN